MIQLFTHNLWTEVEGTLFKDGCPNPRLNEPQRNYIETASKVVIKAHIPDMTEMFKLILTIDAIRRVKPDSSINLCLPYLPFARQDRVCNKGEANGISAFARILNSLELASVELLDPHSDAAESAINRCVKIDLANMLAGQNVLGWMNFSNTWFVAPDAGAVKRVKELARSLGAAGVITASKERDTETMALTKTVFDDEVADRNLLVIDDLCDGGRTFISLSKAIYAKGTPSTLRLWVTHGIFSYGTEVVTDHFDGVYTTNSFQPDAIGHIDGAGGYNQKMHWTRF